jgi:mitochondrial fission protein ELM1
MTSDGKLTIWALLDDRPGNTTQTLGVAQALKGRIAEKRIYFDLGVRLPNVMRRGAALGIDTVMSDALDEGPVPDVIIAAGRRLAPVLRKLKKAFPDAYTVQLMYPDMSLRHFDLVVVPEHDQRSEKQLFTTLGAPHRVSAAKIAEHAMKWRLNMHRKGMTSAFIIGGSTDRGEMTVADMEALWEQSAALRSGGTLLVTTSRRTPELVTEWLRAHVNPPHYFLPYGEGENAYPALLELADRLVVTADSVSMLSEACVTGKPVYAFDALDCLKPKHKRLLDSLCARGHVRRLADFDAHWPGGPVLDEASRVAAHILSQLPDDRRQALDDA